LIIVYITLRFDFKFAVPVILAMIHDILVTVGIYSLVFKEVTVDTVAAVLTVLGYSIYDTIIIFDRIRENVPLMRRAPFATIANVSLWETIRRSLATTFITLLPIIALLIFGGATLKDFAFALIIGIVSGAYSSIFIAAPLLTAWKEREPEFARRKGQEPEADADGGFPSRLQPRLPGGAPAAVDGGTLAREEARSIVEELIGRWRNETVRLSERTGNSFAGLFRELGLVTRGEVEELELRVAQLEHRLRLIETSEPASRI